MYHKHQEREQLPRRSRLLSRSFLVFKLDT